MSRDRCRAYTEAELFPWLGPHGTETVTASRSEAIGKFI